MKNDGVHTCIPKMKKTDFVTTFCVFGDDRILRLTTAVKRRFWAIRHHLSLLFPYIYYITIFNYIYVYIYTCYYYYLIIFYIYIGSDSSDNAVAWPNRAIKKCHYFCHHCVLAVMTVVTEFWYFVPGFVPEILSRSILSRVFCPRLSGSSQGGFRVFIWGFLVGDFRCAGLWSLWRVLGRVLSKISSRADTCGKRWYNAFFACVAIVGE